MNHVFVVVEKSIKNVVSRGSNKTNPLSLMDDDEETIMQRETKGDH